MRAVRKRHPIIGFFGGLFLGLGVALLLVLYGKIAFGTLTPYVIILAGMVLGVVWAFVAPARGRARGAGVAPPPPVVPAGPPPDPDPDPDPDAVAAAPAAAPEPEPEPDPEPEPPPPPAAEAEPGSDAPAAAAADAGVGWTATHVVPATGLTTYAGSEENGVENGRLDPGLEVQVVEQQGDWAHVVCSNGWRAWVDARQLLAVP